MMKIKNLNKEAVAIVAAVAILVTILLGFVSAGWNELALSAAGIMVHRTTQQEVIYLLSHVLKQIPAGVIAGAVTALMMW